MSDSSDIKRVEFVVLGIFLTLFVQSQSGSFDRFYDSLLVTLALQDQTSWTRALYHLLGENEFAANIRAENPVGFFVLNGLFCAILAEVVSIPIRIVAFSFGMLAQATAPEIDNSELIEETPPTLPEPSRG